MTLLTVDDENELTLNLIPLKNYSYSRFTHRENMDRIQAIDTMLNAMAWTPGLTSEANPIDIPVDIYSMSSPGSYQLLYNSVPPGEGVTISNLSSVDLDNASANTPSGLQGMKVQFQNNEGQVFWDAMQFSSTISVSAANENIK